VKEPQITHIVDSEMVASSTYPLTRLASTWSQMSEYKDLMRFIATGFFVGEGAGVIFHMSVIYAVTVCNIDYTTVMLATIFSRFIGVGFALGWGGVVRHKMLGPKTPQRCYAVVVGLLVLCCLLCATLAHPWQYWLLATLLSLAGTGAFSFSRSLLSSLCPPDKASEMFGYSAMVGHVAGFLGPLLFAGVVHVTETPRSGFVVIMGFLLVGSFLLTTTDFERGQARANGQPCTNLTDAKTAEEERRLIGPPASAWQADGASEPAQDTEVRNTEAGNMNPIVDV